MLSHVSNRLLVLDGLRALAIVLVLCRHSVRPFWPELSNPYIPVGAVDLGAILINGWIGVDLFFVLSGFLIARSLLQRFENKAGFVDVVRGYAPQRFFRIAPVYYLVLVVAVLGLFPFYPYPSSHEGIGGRIAYHLMFMQDYFPSDIVVVFWSLAIEIKFYLLAPVLVFGLVCMKKVSARALVLLALVASQPLMRWVFAPDVSGFEGYFLEVRTAFHLCLDGLLMGVLAAVLWGAPRVRAVLSRSIVANGLFAVGAGTILVLGFSGPLVDVGVSAFDKVWLVTIISAGFAAMLLGLLGGAAVRRAFEGRSLTFIALISYSLYLVHLPLLYLAEVMGRIVFDFDQMSAQAGYLAFLPFFIALCAAVSTVLYVAVERPFILWSKKKYSSQA